MPKYGRKNIEAMKFWSSSIDTAPEALIYHVDQAAQYIF